MKNWFLYILKFKTEPIIKIGISLQKDLSRIKQLSKFYQFDLDSSLIVTSSDNVVITRFEKQLQADYSFLAIPEEYQLKYQGVDGCTELLMIDALDYILDDIHHKQKKSWLDIQVTTGIKLPEPASTGSSRRTRKIKIDEIVNLGEMYEILEMIKSGEYVDSIKLFMDGQQLRYTINTNDQGFCQRLFDNFQYRLDGGAGGRLSDERDYTRTSVPTYSVSGNVNVTPIFSNDIDYINAMNQLQDFMKEFYDTLLASPKLNARNKPLRATI